MPHAHSLASLLLPQVPTSGTFQAVLAEHPVTTLVAVGLAAGFLAGLVTHLRWQKRYFAMEQGAREALEHVERSATCHECGRDITGGERALVVELPHKKAKGQVWTPRVLRCGKCEGA